METKVKKTDKVWVTGTGAGKFLKKGAKAKVHSILAKKLIDKGVAVEGENLSAADEKNEKAKKQAKGKVD